jgi:PAS domain S-box-containing protein
MRRPLRILSIEDDPKDTELIQNLLESEDMVCEITRVDTQAAVEASLEQGGIDLILADYTLPAFDGLSALKLAMKTCPEVPFIFVSGTLGEEVAIEALKVGATDYVLKTRLSRLVPSVLRALREASERAEHKQANEKLRQSEAYLAEAQRLSLTGSFGCRLSTGEMFWSEETFRIYGYDLSTQPAIERVLQRVHPDDRPLVQEQIDRASHGGKDCHVECRLLLPDDSVKHVRIVAHASKNDPAMIEFIGAVMDVTATKKAEEKLRRSEAYLAEAQKLSHTGSFGWDVSSGEIYWSRETFRIFGYEPAAKATIDMVLQRTHPEDRPAVQELIERVSRERRDFDFEHRLLMADGSVKYLRVIGSPSENEDSCFEFVGAVTDITESKRAEEALRRSESYLAEAQKIAHTASWVWQVAGRDAVHLSEEWYRIYGFDPAEGMPAWEKRLERVHPADRAKWQGTIERAILEKSHYDVEFRILLADGAVKYIHMVGHPIVNASGDLVQFVGMSTDVTERKRAEETLRRSEGYLAEAQRLTRSGSWAWDVRTRDVFWSQEMFRIFDYDPEKVRPTLSCFLERVHPDDRPALEERAKVESTQKERGDSEADYRIILDDGTIKYLHSIAHSVVNESGEITEVIGTTMDVTEQHEARTALETAFEQIKALKDQLYNENVALREEIDRSSMFEEIVGESPALQAVLAHVVKVAPTDSTVLITGETGTGKELIARAIHKRSQRAARAFVSVNCAVIPPSLIASELFGHEKGAFTGAIQRRLGRFELAEGGTIFLDEIGELPPDTQIALLRVLQEREFERVGGGKVIRANVRVIAATNRDLQGSINAGTFRSDLYYRLNVFPIEMPPLRRRREDIPLLVEYFIDRYASKAGKKIRGISRATLERLKSYSWPGNIRELQNVIERSVIVCETETFTVDESWLSRTPTNETTQVGGPLSKMPPSQEKETIEAALAHTQGRISGPTGAAAKLGIPPSTLDSKIKAFKINKHRFKTA